MNHSGEQEPDRVPPTNNNIINRKSNLKIAQSHSSSLPSIRPNIDPGISQSQATLASSGERYLVPDDLDEGKTPWGEDENKARGNWSGKLDFLLSCLGYAVGLGNVWRFPYLCNRHGGGAFFIPYIIMLIFVGIPLFFLEMSFGQFCSNGPLTCWSILPLLKGVGVAQLIVSGLVSIYYNMIIAWSIYYLFASLSALPGLPWTTCSEWWNTGNCSEKLPDVDCTSLPNHVMYDNGTCYNSTSFVGLWNYTIFNNVTGIKRYSSSEEYYRNRVLSISSGIEEMGGVKWDLTLCLIGAWIISFFCMIKGIKSSGKVVYFTALFPYVVLVILLFRGATLPNAYQGVYFYVVPDWGRLLDAKVWNDAAVQIFFSLGNCWGGLIALSSYNRFHNNCLRDTLIVAIGNCVTSIFAGFVIFSFLGFMAGELNTTVEKVVDSGAGLAFIVYPDAVSRMPASPLWAILFFLMLITLGLDTQFAMLETVLTSIMDQFPWIRKDKTKVILVMSIVMFFLGLTLCTNGGVYMLQLMDTYCGGWALLIIGLVECIGLAWVYGQPRPFMSKIRYFDDIAVMTGKEPSIWWRVCWQFISPILILFILIFSWVDYSPAKYGDYYWFPVWADVIGWLMTLTSAIWIPIIAIYMVCKEEGPILERLRNLTLPTIEWGPALVKHRKLIDYVPGFVVDPWDTGTQKHVIDGEENLGMNYQADPKRLCNLTLPTIESNTEQKNVSGIYVTPSASRSNLSYIPSINTSLSGSKSQVSVGALTNLSFESSV